MKFILTVLLSLLDQLFFKHFQFLLQLIYLIMKLLLTRLALIVWAK